MRKRMKAEAGVLLALAALVWTAGCGSTEQAAAPDRSGGGAAAGPVTTFESEKEKRWQDAIRGLDFESGRVVIEQPAAQRRPLRAQRDFEDGLEALGVRQDYVGAIGLFRDALEADDSLGEVYEPLGDALRGKGRAAWTVAAYRTAIDAGLDSADLRFKLAMQLWGMDAFDQAHEEMRRSGELDADRADVHERLAVWSYYLGDDDAAWFHVHEARARGGDVPPQFIPLLEARRSDPND